MARALFLAFRFVVELVLLFGFGYWAYKLELLPQVRLVVGIAAVTAAATMWAIFVSPKAAVRLPESGRLTAELCIVAASVAALRASGRVREALLLATVAVAVAVINSVLRRSAERGLALSE